MPKAPKGLTNKRDAVEFQCPWRGHRLEPAPLVVRNPAVPGLMGRICHDCNCMVYVVEDVSPIVAPGSVGAGFSGFPIREPQSDDRPKES